MVAKTSINPHKLAKIKEELHRFQEDISKASLG